MIIIIIYTSKQVKYITLSLNKNDLKRGFDSIYTSKGKPGKKVRGSRGTNKPPNIL